MKATHCFNTIPKKMIDYSLPSLLLTIMGIPIISLIFPFNFYTFIPIILIILICIIFYKSDYQRKGIVIITMWVIGFFWMLIGPIIVSKKPIYIYSDPTIKIYRSEIINENNLGFFYLTNPIRHIFIKLISKTFKDKIYLIEVKEIGEDGYLIIPISYKIEIEHPDSVNLPISLGLKSKLLCIPLGINESEFELSSDLKLIKDINNITIGFTGGLKRLVYFNYLYNNSMSPWEGVKIKGRPNIGTLKYLGLVSHGIRLASFGDIKNSVTMFLDSLDYAPSKIEKARIYTLLGKIINTLYSGNLGQLQSLVLFHNAFDNIDKEHSKLPDINKTSLENWIHKTLRETYSIYGSIFRSYKTALTPTERVGEDEESRTIFIDLFEEYRKNLMKSFDMAGNSKDFEKSYEIMLNSYENLIDNLKKYESNNNFNQKIEDWGSIDNEKLALLLPKLEEKELLLFYECITFKTTSFVWFCFQHVFNLDQHEIDNLYNNAHEQTQILKDNLKKLPEYYKDRYLANINAEIDYVTFFYNHFIKLIEKKHVNEENIRSIWIAYYLDSLKSENIIVDLIKLPIEVEKFDDQLIDVISENLNKISPSCWYSKEFRNWTYLRYLYLSLLMPKKDEAKINYEDLLKVINSSHNFIPDLVFKLIVDGKFNKTKNKKEYRQLRQMLRANVQELIFGRKEREIKLRHILIKVDEYASPKDEENALNKIKYIREQILYYDKSFEEMALKYSDDPFIKENKGVLGEYFKYEDLRADLRDIVLNLRLNEISEPIKVNQGFCLFQVVDILGSFNFQEISFETKSNGSSFKLLFSKSISLTPSIK